MTAIFAQLFVTPLELSGPQRMLLIVPLCLSISLIYKATRLENLRALPGAVAALCLTIVVGMYAVGVGLWAIFHIRA